MSRTSNTEIFGYLTAVAACLCLLCLAACSVDTPPAEGRPCSPENLACGPGYRCDVKAGKCVKDDNGQKDGGAGDKTIPPDVKKPDSYMATDAGCPKGMTRCGKVCADLQSDKLHCGTCDQACSTAEADSCVAGTCVCGKTGKVCGAGLDCVLGACTCKKGGRCKGCCDGTLCRTVDTMQSLTKCGKGGDSCRACKTSSCAITSCKLGGCLNTWQPGKSCNDGKPCTYTDTCSSTGTCTGTSYKCDDNATCTTDNCTGNTPPYQCNYKVSTGYCAILSGSSTVCYKSGAIHPKDNCLYCSPSTSQTTWSKKSGCTTTATVSTMLKTHTFSGPRGVAVDSAGLIYVSDTNNHVVKRINPTTFTVSYMAGKTGTSGFTNGTGSAALFKYPTGIAVDSMGNIYVADSGNHAIRMISGKTGATSTVAGNGSIGSTDGTLSVARFYNPNGVAVDSYGNIYVADTYNHKIRKITSKAVSTYAGSGSTGYADGALLSAKFYNPYDVADYKGRLFVADRSNHRIRLITNLKVSTVAGSGTKGFKDGSGTAALFYYPRGLIVSNSTGRVYVADTYNNRIRSIYGSTVTTLAGTGISGKQDGAATSATFYHPSDVAIHSSGKIYVADYNNSKLRLITISGVP